MESRQLVRVVGFWKTFIRRCMSFAKETPPISIITCLRVTVLAYFLPLSDLTTKLTMYYHRGFGLGTELGTELEKSWHAELKPVDRKYLMT